GGLFSLASLSRFADVLLGNQAMSSIENLIGLIEAHVNRFDEFINRYSGELIDSFDAPILQPLSSDLIERKALAYVGKRRFTAGHHRFKLRSGSASGFLRAANVNVPAYQLRREPHVLSLLANRQRELVLGNCHCKLLLFEAVNLDLRHLSRRERVSGEHRRVFAPLDYVDALATQLANDRLHARAFHPDAGADRIDIALGRDHRDLRSVTGLANGGLDLDRAVVDFGDFHLEQPFQ